MSSAFIDRTCEIAFSDEDIDVLRDVICEHAFKGYFDEVCRAVAVIAFDHTTFERPLLCNNRIDYRNELVIECSIMDTIAKTCDGSIPNDAVFYVKTEQDHEHFISADIIMMNLDQYYICVYAIRPIFEERSYMAELRCLAQAICFLLQDNNLIAKYCHVILEKYKSKEPEHDKRFKQLSEELKTIWAEDRYKSIADWKEPPRE